MSYILTPAQREIAIDRHRFRVCCTGRRVGKTTLAVLEMLGKACSKPDVTVAYCALTYQQARDLAWMPLKKLAEPVTVKADESRLELIVRAKGGGTSRITLRGWENIETLRGMKLDFIVIDEIASMRNWDENWQAVIRPTLTDVRGEALFISTPAGYNHFWELYNKEREDTDYKSFHFTSYDNPNIPIEEIDKARRELTEDRFEQEYMASFRKTEGLVYKEFDRLRHLTDDRPKNVIRKMAGVDFGFTNPSVILTVHEDNDRTFWVTDEWYRHGKTNSELIEYARTLDVATFYPDPAEPARIAEMQRGGLACAEVNKDIRKGIDSVRALFKTDKLRIHRSCVNLIRELETYCYKEKQTDRNEAELPIPENDHALDAIRYCLFMRSPLPAVAYVRKAMSFEGETTTY